MTEVPWYRKAFRSFYTEIYAHRDREEAARAIALLGRLVPLPGARVLDAACGAGRHLEALGARRARPVGFDLSPHLLRASAAAAPVARADLRAFPFRSGAFDGVLSMFTSFGYFEEDEENLRVLREAARVLRAGGWFLLDYLNAEGTIAGLRREGTRRAGRFTITERRRYDRSRRLLCKEILLTGEGIDERWEERLRLYFPDELAGALARAGLKPEERLGDYEGGRFDREAPRLILFCRRSTEEGRNP